MGLWESCGGRFGDLGKSVTFVPGEVAEWSIAAVLKTVELHGSGGSNPSLSAREKKDAGFVQSKNETGASFFLPRRCLNFRT